MMSCLMYSRSEAGISAPSATLSVRLTISKRSYYLYDKRGRAFLKHQCTDADCGMEYDCKRQDCPSPFYSSCHHYKKTTTQGECQS